MNYETGNIYNLHYGIIHSNQSHLINCSSLPFINTNKIPKKYTLIKNGDLILADTSENRNDSAKGIEIINDSNLDIISGLHTIHLREKQTCTINGFKAYYVASKSFRKFAKKYCEGIKVFSIKSSLLRYANFAYPQDKKEQEMIVNFLRKIDYKNELLERKIETLKKYKEGLCDYLFKESIHDSIHLYDLVANNPSQMLTKDIEQNVGIYPVYDATGKILKFINYYQQSSDTISIIKYGSGCGRTFISKGYHSILGTMTDLKPFDQADVLFIYAYTLSRHFASIIKKYIEIGTTPNLYFSDYSKATISNKAIKNKKIISLIIRSIEKKELLLFNEFNKLKNIKKYLLNSLFI